MRYRKLGSSDLEVSEISLGSWLTYSGGVEFEHTRACTDAEFEAGINFFDTANVYGWKTGEGVTEQIIGRWLAQGGRRDRIVLATKVYGTMGDGPNDRRLSAYHIRRACDESLRRLQTDRIDLYQMHHVDRAAPWAEIWQAMEQLVQQGKVLYVGSSNFAGWHLAQAQETARARHFMGLVSDQSLYNLTERTLELEVLPACEGYGIGQIPYSCLAGGLLGGVLEKVKSGRRASEDIQQEIAKRRPQLESYEKLCAEIGRPPGEVALAWVLHQKAVTSPIIGPRTVQQLDDAVKASSVTLLRETLKRLDEIFPGPGGPAPEAYAW